MGAARSLDGLRATLEARFGAAVLPAPGTAPARERPGFRTGVRAIDRLLPGGVPRRAVTVWAGPAGAGRTAALRALAEAACRTGARVAVVDATATLDAAAWCADGAWTARLWVARPPSAAHAEEGAWVAETLLRTGAFGLVALDGPSPAPDAAHRLRALARETDAALLVSTPGGEGGWRADVRLEFRRGAGGPGLGPGGRFRRGAAVRIARDAAGARHGERELELVDEPTDRLRADPAVPDRRVPPRA